jgi:hypothetical protein
MGPPSRSGSSHQARGRDARPLTHPPQNGVPELLQGLGRNNRADHPETTDLLRRRSESPARLTLLVNRAGRGWDMAPFSR